MSGTFDPEAFLDGAAAEAVSDQYENPPEGTFQAQVFDKNVVDVETKNGTQYILRINWELLDDTVRQQLGRETVRVRQDIWLDMDENGALATGKGKNVALGRLYTALGINKAGVRPRDIDGMAMVHVSHRSDKKDPQKKYAEVDRVAPLA